MNKFFLATLLFCSSFALAQVGDNYFISSPSAVAVKPGLLDFRIYHLFGDIAGDNGGFDNFYGYDNARDIKFSFDYGITDKFNIGIYRTKGAYVRSQIVGLNGKYTFFEKSGLGENQNNKLMAAFFGSAAGSTQTASTNPEEETFFPSNSSRLMYTSIAVIQYQSTRWDLMLSGMYNHRNFVSAAEDNGNYGIITGAKYAVNKVFRLGLDALLPFNDTKPGFTLDFEFDTGGHVFQLYISQYSAVTPEQNLLYGFEDLSEGQFRFGFMISRPFKL